MNLELDTINKIVTLKAQSFKIDDLLFELENLGLKDWTIQINGIYYYNPQPQIYPFETFNRTADINPLGPMFTTSNSIDIPVDENVFFAE